MLQDMLGGSSLGFPRAEEQLLIFASDMAEGLKKYQPYWKNDFEAAGEQASKEEELASEDAAGEQASTEEELASEDDATDNEGQVESGQVESGKPGDPKDSRRERIEKQRKKNKKLGRKGKLLTMVIACFQMDMMCSTVIAAQLMIIILVRNFKNSDLDLIRAFKATMNSRRVDSFSNSMFAKAEGLSGIVDKFWLLF